MAEIHHTTVSPSKLEMLVEWLPEQPWYAGRAGAPQLSRAVVVVGGSGSG